MSLPYTLAEAVRAQVHAGALELRVALPAVVKAYHPSEQTVDVQPSVTLPRELEDDTVVEETVNTIYRVPCQFPGGGGYVLTFPVAPGDMCLLVFTDRSLDNWMGSAGGVVDPVDVRLHDLSDAVALLGVRPAGAALTPAPPTDRVVLGTPGGLRIEVGPGTGIDLGGGSSDYVALASKVDAMRATFNTHTHPTAGTGPPSVPSSLMSSPVGSSSVKVAT